MIALHHPTLKSSSAFILRTVRGRASDNQTSANVPVSNADSHKDSSPTVNMSDNVPYGHGVMTSEPEAGGQATNAFDATAMAAALPDPQGGDHGSAPAEANGENGEAGTAAGADGNQAQGKYGWNDPVAHDYAELTRADAAKWDGNARVYYWDGETGDIGPEFPELEDELFGSAGSAERHAHGLDFAA